MSLHRLLPLYLRDMRDAIRDGRILIAVLIPVGLAVFYGLSFPSEDSLPTATLTVAGPKESRLVREVRNAVQDQIDLTVSTARNADAVRSAVRDDSEVVGLVLERDVDSDVTAGRSSSVTLVLDEESDGTARQLAAVVEGVAARLGADPPPLRVERTQLGSQPATNAFDALGIARASIVLCIVMLAGFVAFLAVPVLLMEEVQLRTLEALQLVSSTWEIITAKLLVGLTYCAIAIAITIALVDVSISSPTAFVVAALVTSLVLVGWGLAFGLWMGDPGRVNTWSGVILLPLLIPVFIVLGGPEDRSWTWIMELVPTGGGALLLANAMEPEAQSLTAAPLVALAAWTVAGFALLWWLLERRDA